MKLGRLPRGLAVAALAAVTVVPLAASAAAAAPVAPTAYAVFGSGQPLFWAGSSSLPVGWLHVPFVAGLSTNSGNLAFATAEAKLATADKHLETLSGEDINGLTCRGYDENRCKDPFLPTTDELKHSGPDAAHAERAAFFTGRDGKFPGSIQALTDCPGNCGEQLVRSQGSGIGPGGGLPGYVRIGSSSARYDLSIDDKGRLVSTARSTLEHVAIGPENEVTFSSLVTTAEALGAGAENSKDGRADLRITDFYILGYRVELTRAGLRLANGGPSEQEAYDGAKVLLKKLRDRGIVLELPNFDAQVVRTPTGVTVDTQGLRVRFEHAVGSVNASTVPTPLELGHATAVVAAVDADRNIEVRETANGPVIVENAAPPAPVVSRGAPSTGGQQKKGVNSPRETRKGEPQTTRGTSRPVPPNSTPGVTPPPAPVGNGAPDVVATPPDPGSQTGIAAPTPAPDDPSVTALPGLGDLEGNLGLRDARSVSRAFGAFLGLGLILPLARFLIRRLG